MITKPLLAVQADLDKIKYPVLASPKLDGIRCLIINGVPVSRNFKPIPNKYIRDTLKQLPDGLDGELMLQKKDATFQEITSAVMSFEGKPHFVYMAFDYVTDLTIPFGKRLENLTELYGKYGQLGLLKSILLKNEKEVLNFEEKCLESGFEGIMLRDPDGPYKCGRSTVKEGILLKVKRFEDGEAKIIGLVEKEINQNEQTRDELGRAKRSTAKAGKVKAGTLGAFIVKDLKTGVEFSIGSGFDDAFRDKVWTEYTKYDPFKFSNKIIKYKYQATGVKEAPRFPVFLGFRDAADL